MKYFKSICCLIFLSLFILSAANANQNKILFKINNEIITSYDLDVESKYLKLINKNLNRLEKKRLDELASNSLINHYVKKIEILKYNQFLKIDENYLNLFIKNLYSGLSFETEQDFINFLKNNKLEYDTLREKIKVEALWNDMIYSKYVKEIKIDKIKINQELKLKNKSIKNYLLSEIFFQIKKDETIDEKFLEIVKIINKDGFDVAASIFSISNSAASGGQIGWTYETSIRKDFLNLLVNLNVGEHTKPITLPGGFLILKINDVKIEEFKLNLEEEINKIVKIRTNEQLNQFSNIYLEKVKKNLIINDF